MGGKLRFAARQAANEFLALFEHDDFQAVIGVGFDTRAMLMQGLCMAHFEGDPFTALAWVDAIARHLAAKPPSVNASVAYGELSQLMQRCN
jgi:hypothetical protein